MVDHRAVQDLFGPLQRIRVAALTREEEGPEMRQVTALEQLRLGVVTPDGPERGRRGEQRSDLVLLDDAPIDAGIRRADRLALEQDSRVAGKQRRIDDVGVADDPANVGGGPEHLARLHAIDVLHGPVQHHHVAAIVAHHALGLARRAGGVEDVERVQRAYRHAIRRLGFGDGLDPVDIAPLDHRRLALRPLEDDAEFGLVLGQLDGAVEQRLVFHHAPRLDAAGGGNHGLAGAVVDPDRELVGRKPAEDHRMHRAEPGAGKHGDRRLRNHRHVDDDPVALSDAPALERAGEGSNGVPQFAVGEGADRVGHRAVVDHRRLVAAACLDMAVKGVEAGVGHPVHEPAPGGRGLRFQDLRRSLVPVQVSSGFRPECLALV